jgi:hypothetical protein
LFSEGKYKEAFELAEKLGKDNLDANRERMSLMYGTDFPEESQQTAARYMTLLIEQTPLQRIAPPMNAEQMQAYYNAIPLDKIPLSELRGTGVEFVLDGGAKNIEALAGGTGYPDFFKYAVAAKKDVNLLVPALQVLLAFAGVPAALGTTIAGSSVGAAIGLGSIGVNSAAAIALGSAVIGAAGAAVQGGDFEDVLKAGLIAGGLGYLTAPQSLESLKGYLQDAGLIASDAAKVGVEVVTDAAGNVVTVSTGTAPPVSAPPVSAPPPPAAAPPPPPPPPTQDELMDEAIAETVADTVPETTVTTGPEAPPSGPPVAPPTPPPPPPPPPPPAEEPPLDETVVTTGPEAPASGPPVTAPPSSTGDDLLDEAISDTIVDGLPETVVETGAETDVGGVAPPVVDGLPETVVETGGEPETETGGGPPPVVDGLPETVVETGPEPETEVGGGPPTVVDGLPETVVETGPETDTDVGGGAAVTTPPPPPPPPAAGEDMEEFIVEGARDIAQTEPIITAPPVVLDTTPIDYGEPYDPNYRWQDDLKNLIEDAGSDYLKSQLIGGALGELFGPDMPTGAGGVGSGYQGTGGLGYIPEGQERRYIAGPDDYLHGLLPEWMFFENLNPPAVIDNYPGTSPIDERGGDNRGRGDEGPVQQDFDGGIVKAKPKIYSPRDYLEMVRGYNMGGVAELPVGDQDAARNLMTDGNKDLIDLTRAVILGEVDERADEIIQKFIDLYGYEEFQSLRDQTLEQMAPRSVKSGLIRGQTGGMDDMVDGVIGSQERVAVSPGEFIVPADVVAALGDGNTEKGGKELEKMMERTRMQKYGSRKQPPPVNLDNVMPA